MLKHSEGWWYSSRGLIVRAGACLRWESFSKTANIVHLQLVCVGSPVPDRQSEREGKIADGGSLLAAYCVQFVNRLTKQTQTWPEEMCLL